MSAQIKVITDEMCARAFDLFESGVAIKDVAKATGIPRRAAKNMKLYAPKPKPSEIAQQVINAYKNGSNRHQIVAMYGISLSSVVRTLIKARVLVNEMPRTKRGPAISAEDLAARDVQIRHWHETGLGWAAIADKLKLTRMTVQKRGARLGLKLAKPQDDGLNRRQRQSRKERSQRAAVKALRNAGRAEVAPNLVLRNVPALRITGSVSDAVAEFVRTRGVNLMPAVALLPTQATLPADDRKIVRDYHNAQISMAWKDAKNQRMAGLGRQAS